VGTGAGVAAPVAERFGHQFGSVVASDVGRCAPSGLDEVLEDADGLVGVDRAGCDAGERLAGVFVGDVEDLDRPAISGLVEEVVERPDLVGTAGADRARRPSGLPPPPLAPGDVQPFVTPQPLHPLAVASPALALEQHVHAPIAVARMPTGEHMQLGTQPRLVRGTLAAVTLR